MNPFPVHSSPMYSPSFHRPWHVNGIPSDGSHRLCQCPSRPIDSDDRLDRVVGWCRSLSFSARANRSFLQYRRNSNMTLRCGLGAIIPGLALTLVKVPKLLSLLSRKRVISRNYLTAAPSHRIVWRLSTWRLFAHVGLRTNDWEIVGYVRYHNTKPANIMERARNPSSRANTAIKNSPIVLVARASPVVGSPPFISTSIMAPNWANRTL